MTEQPTDEPPFRRGDWLIDEGDPSRPGEYTGQYSRAGTNLMLELRYADGSTKRRPLHKLRLRGLEAGLGVDALLESGRFGKLGDMRRLLTFEKLRGTLHEVIYSMEAAQVDFYPYQFKPVTKFIDSPTDRLVIADEVGLGKTIEALLIWMELVARRQAKRLLVVCPSFLMPKWKQEFQSKFMIDARIVNAGELASVVSDMRTQGPGYSQVAISSYSSLRPPKSEASVLTQENEAGSDVSVRTKLLQDLRHWSSEYDPFDLVIFDEAHYMRNTSTASFKMGEAISLSAGAVLCVSATPVNNRSADLHSLLRLVDPDFFETQGTFDALLADNSPTVRAGNALARIPVDVPALEAALEGMRKSRYIGPSPLFQELLDGLPAIVAGEAAPLARALALIEKLNLLGAYVTRTRRVQVKENRPIRDIEALTLSFSREERLLYDAILKLVRRQCRANREPFHVFRVMQFQLRAASCLPVIAREILSGRLGDPEDLLIEAVGDQSEEEEGDEIQPLDLLGRNELQSLLEFDFEGHDTKYEELRRLLVDKMPEDKAIVFSFYRASLHYLARRLTADGVPVAVIHGGLGVEERLKEIEAVQTSTKRMVLLSSEVGSEGLDLQFCRVVVNYDLPWNPMRVEQRIGRIDRVGQVAKRLTIVNFKVEGTIEERLFDRLHAKLMAFSHSLGDLDEVIGQEVRRLSIRLMSEELTAEEEQLLIDQTGRVLQQKLVDIQTLEETGDALVSHADYLQRQLEEAHQRGRFIRPEELEDYIVDFFEREFRGCEVSFDVPERGCLALKLTQEAFQSLQQFLGDDRSMAAQPFRRREMKLSFRREAVMGLSPEVKRQVVFASHMSPLVRWVTAMNQEQLDLFHPVTVARVSTDLVPPGDYLVRVERWQLKGLTKREQLAYAAKGIRDGDEVSEGVAEELVQALLRSGSVWDYPVLALDEVAASNQAAQRLLQVRFDEAARRFENENSNALRIRRERVKAIFERKLVQDERRIQTTQEAGRGAGAIRLMEGRKKKTQEARDERLRRLSHGEIVEPETAVVAAAVVRVEALR